MFARSRGLVLDPREGPCQPLQASRSQRSPNRLAFQMVLR
jgi:hypothetical protein